MRLAISKSQLPLSVRAVAVAKVYKCLNHLCRSLSVYIAMLRQSYFVDRLSCNILA
jgi:hypothetical protein